LLNQCTDNTENIETNMDDWKLRADAVVRLKKDVKMFVSLFMFRTCSPQMCGVYCFTALHLYHEFTRIHSRYFGYRTCIHDRCVCDGCW